MNIRRTVDIGLVFLGILQLALVGYSSELDGRQELRGGSTSSRTNRGGGRPQRGRNHDLTTGDAIENTVDWSYIQGKRALAKCVPKRTMGMRGGSAGRQGCSKGRTMRMILIPPAPTPPPTSAPTSTSDLVLGELRRRDEAMELVLVNYHTTTVLEDPGGPSFDVVSSSYAYSPMEFEVEFDASMASNSSGATFERILDFEDDPDDPAELTGLAQQKWTSVSLLVQELSRAEINESLVTPEDYIYETYSEDTGAKDIVAWQEIAVKLAHGYGLGERISSLDVAESSPDGGWSLEGSLTVGTNDDVAFYAELDTEFIVVEATLIHTSEDAYQILDTTAENPVTPAGGDDIPALATQGSARSSMQPIASSGGGDETIELDMWTSVFVSASRLSAQEFDDYSTLVVPENATIFDYVDFGGRSRRRLTDANFPTPEPSPSPSWPPTLNPTPAGPTGFPTAYPTMSVMPSDFPTPGGPTESPAPTESPSIYPTPQGPPTGTPTLEPTFSPTLFPTPGGPSQMPDPTELPTGAIPSTLPTGSPAPTVFPTPGGPTESPAPTVSPSYYPTPQGPPTGTPTLEPTFSPTLFPTPGGPSQMPDPTESPTGAVPSALPTDSPAPTSSPSSAPTTVDTNIPTDFPTPSSSGPGPTAIPEVPSDAPSAFPSPAGPSAMPTCPPCKEEWVSQQELIGGLECQHGPEHDNSAACIAARASGTVICKEIDPVNFNCECFKCQQPWSITCEEHIQQWLAWCGPGDHDDECETEIGTIGPAYRFRKARTRNGAICDGVNGNYQSVEFCGPPSVGPRRAHLGCRATNCVTVGNFGAARRRRRLKCK